MSARSFCRFNGLFYIGGSTPSINTDIWSYSKDYTTDNGIAIEPYVWTPDFIPVNRSQDTKYKSLWVYNEPSTVFSSMTVTVHINKNPAAHKTMVIDNTPVSDYEEMFIKSRLNNELLHGRFRTVSFKFSGFSKLFGFDFEYGFYNAGEK
jgi:hypothetical protein